MHNLTTVDGTLEYLKDTRFAASDVQLLSGGHSAFTYRAVLKTPLPSGDKTVVIKHFEGYIALYDFVKIEVQRADFEYKALSALANSSLFDSNSVVQVPMPVEYDSETHTIFMTDLGSPTCLTKVLQESLEADSSDESGALDPNAAYALAAEIGSALGDFLGRFHNWTALPEQAELRNYCLKNIAAIDHCLSFHLDCMARSAGTFGVKETWVDELIAREKEEAWLGGSVLSMGDCWLDNILVSLPSGNEGLRVYLVDWEMTRPTPPEFDIGEVTGTALSFGRRFYPQGEFPFVPALHQAYRKHRALDPVQAAIATGIDMMGFGTVLPWARDQSQEYLRGVTMTGFELIQLARDGDDNIIREKSLLKHLFSIEPQQVMAFGLAASY